MNNFELVGILNREKYKLLKGLHAFCPDDRHKVRTFEKRKGYGLISDMFGMQREDKSSLSERTGSNLGDDDTIGEK